MARDLGIARAGEKIWWGPAHLPRLRELIPPAEPLALYGPGPVWLYAALAAHAAPSPFYLFDARHYGWMAPPPVILDADQANETFTLTVQPEGEDVRLTFDSQPPHYVLKQPPVPVHTPPTHCRRPNPIPTR